jgi:[ribosomal protein S18]-alanine N-acetyltransferase
MTPRAVRIEAIGPQHARLAAHVHAASFLDAWSAATFADLLSEPVTLCAGAFFGDGLAAFALAQTVAGEADLLTLATLPDQRGQGLARAVTAFLLDRLKDQGVTRMTLDVAEDNVAALALYTSLGFDADGRRAKYYARPGLAPVDAVLMSCRLIAHA